jgi:hypothetical protein
LTFKFRNSKFGNLSIFETQAWVHTANSKERRVKSKPQPAIHQQVQKKNPQVAYELEASILVDLDCVQCFLEHIYLEP